MKIPGVLITLFDFILALPKVIINVIIFLILLITKIIVTIIFFIINIFGNLYNLFIAFIPIKNKKYFTSLKLKKGDLKNG